MNTTDLQTLRSNVARLTQADQTFASSLIAQYDRKGSLSDKQWPWIARLAARTVPAAQAIDLPIGDLSDLRAMFDRAAQKLKFPHLAIRLPDGSAAKVWFAGERARQPGSLTIQGPDRERLGSVSLDGTWHPAQGRDAGFYVSVATIITQLLASPADTLSLHGKQLGACCYCRIGLTDPRSLAAGYGPTCAKNWGLAWG